MGAPLVSVIIPCFNAEQYVGEAIESALGQTYPHKEVIVIDDGSSDSSLAVIGSFGNRVRWETWPNQGACAARNRGTELAKGEFIQFLDSDDLLLPHKLQRQLSVARDLENTLVFCDAQAEAGPHPHHARRDSTDDAVMFMLRGGLPTPAPLHRRTWLKQVGGFRVELPCAQERDLHLRLACLGLRFRHLPEILYTVRRREASVSSDMVRVLDQHSGIAWRAYEVLRNSGRLTAERAAGLAGFLVEDARGYLRHGLPEKAEAYFSQARRLHPDGGIPQACGRAARVLQRVLGARAVHGLIQWKWTYQSEPSNL